MAVFPPERTISPRPGVYEPFLFHFFSVGEGGAEPSGRRSSVRLWIALDPVPVFDAHSTTRPPWVPVALTEVRSPFSLHWWSVPVDTPHLRFPIFFCWCSVFVSAVYRVLISLNLPFFLAERSLFPMLAERPFGERSPLGPDLD